MLNVDRLTHCQSHDDSKIVSELNDLKKLVEDGQLNSDPGRFHALELELPEGLKNSDKLIHNQQLERAVESVIYAASSAIDSQSVVGSRLSELNPASLELFSELKPEDSASNVGPGRVGTLPRKADGGIQEWLTALEIDETGSEKVRNIKERKVNKRKMKKRKTKNTLKGEASSGHNDALQQGANSDTPVGRLASFPGSPSATSSRSSSAEHDSLGRALIALSRTKIVQHESSVITSLQDLVSSGVNLNAQDEKGRTAMYWASRKGHLAFVKFLCERGADMNLKSNDGQSAVNKAIAEGHTSIAIFMLKHEAADIEQTGKFGQTPLSCAAKFGRLTILNLLLKCNADLDAQSAHGDTALHLAAYCDKPLCVKSLLLNKPPLASRNQDDRGPLHMAAWGGSNKSVEHLLNAGAPLEAKDSKGATALALAAFRGHNECVKLLLDVGALVEAVDSGGYTPLVLASMNGCIETTKLLLKAGAEVDAQDNGYTSLTYAACFGHRDIIEILLAAGAKTEPKGSYSVLFDVMDKHPDDCEHVFCQYCSGREIRKDIMKYLCGKGADVSSLGYYGESLLECLADCDHIDQDERKAIEKILRRYGAE